MAEVHSCSDPAPGTWTAAASMGGREVVPGQPFFMASFAFSTPIYLTGTDRYVFFESNSYQPFSFSVEMVQNVVGPAPISLRMAASNLDRSVSAAVLGERVQGKEVVVHKSYWYSTDPTTHSIPYVYFRGMIDTVSINEEEDSATVTFEIKNDFVRWDAPLPRNQFSMTCNWIFKSNTPGCQYTGAESLCDRSYERCTVLENTDRFRGFRHMATLESLEIWWGKQRESSKKL